MIPASIPSPGQGSWHLFGPFELRAYAVAIIIGILFAVWIGNRRWVARGGESGVVADIAVWAVPFGLVGARVYHVITDYHLYFGEGAEPIQALYVWRGGLGVWGAIALGAVGAWIGCRLRGISFLAFADAMAPGIAIAQAIGRWGNWFNQELYGRPTTLPWALEIDQEHREQQIPREYQGFETFHPTFLYEFLWLLLVAALVILAERRFRLGYGRAFALYVMGYTAGRVWIESLRIDTVNEVFGVRLNVWTSVVVFLAALLFFVWSARRRPGLGSITRSPEGSDFEAAAVAGAGGGAGAAAVGAAAAGTAEEESDSDDESTDSDADAEPGDDSKDAESSADDGGSASEVDEASDSGDDATGDGDDDATDAGGVESLDEDSGDESPDTGDSADDSTESEPSGTAPAGHTSSAGSAAEKARVAQEKLSTQATELRTRFQRWNQQRRRR